MPYNQPGSEPAAQARGLAYIVKKQPATQWLLIATVAICCGWLSISQSRAEELAAKQKSKLAEAAAQAYKFAEADYLLMQATNDEVYLWSRRLMEAEQKDGAGDEAIAGHVARMKKLQARIAGLWAIGARGGSNQDYWATNYYLLEAESLQKPEAR